MDQHMDDSVNLDGSIGVEFDHNGDQQSALETCLVDAECENSLSQITTSVELENIEGHMMMEAEGGDYLHEISSHDMPILGGEEEIMSDSSHRSSMLSKSDNVEGMDITVIHEQTQESILSQITHGSPEPMLTQGSQEPMLLHSSQESMLSQGSEESMLSRESQKPMPSQGFRETIQSQGSEKHMESQISQEPVLLQASQKLMLSQASQESNLSQGSILLNRSQESNVLHESQKSLLLPASQESQIVQLPQALQDSILSQISGAGQSLLMSGGRIVPQLMTPSQLQLQLMKGQAPRTSSTIKQIAIAPKPNPSLPFAGAKLAALSSVKQVTLAPKPVQLVARKPGSSIVKKIAIGNTQGVSKTPTVLGSYGPGKQLVLVPSSSGGPQRLKLVQGGSVQYIKTGAKPILQPQVTTTKKAPMAATGTKQVMTKVVLQGGDLGSGAGSGQSVLAKVLGSGSGTRFISLQQAQQLGIISCSGAPTGTKLVSMSPSRPITSYGGRMGKPKQPALTTVKSPTKILPALLPQGGGTNKMVSSSPQISRSANEGTAQIVKLESSHSGDKSNSLLANVSSISNIGSRQHFQNIFNTFAAKSIVKVEPSQMVEDQPAVLTKMPQNNSGSNPQIHQISVPGKGVQYVRLVAASQSQTQTSTPRSVVTSGTPVTVDTTSNSNTVFNLAAGNTLLLPDSQGGSYLHMATSKMAVPPLVRGTSTAINKLTSKPQQKLVRIAPVPLKLSQSITKPRTLKDTHTNSISAESIETLEELSLPSSEGENCVSRTGIEDSKTSLRDLIAEELRQNGTEHFSEQSTLLPNSQQSHIEEEEEEDEEMNEEQEEVKEREVAEQLIEDVQMEEKPTQHVFMLPAYMQRDKELSTLVEVKPDIISQFHNAKEEAELSSIRPRKPCNCTKSQCLKLYCDCFANGEFCNQCNCNNCFNNLENEEERQKAIRSCLDRNPSAFRPKIGKAKNNVGPEAVRRHNKGCNCKRSGCLKNYCECYEAKIACSANCKCVGCRNVEDNLDRSRRDQAGEANTAQPTTPKAEARHKRSQTKQPCSFMTSQVIDAVCACLLEAAREETPSSPSAAELTPGKDPVQAVLEEFARCIQDIITASCQAHAS